MTTLKGFANIGSMGEDKSIIYISLKTGEKTNNIIFRKKKLI